MSETCDPPNDALVENNSNDNHHHENGDKDNMAEAAAALISASEDSVAAASSEETVAKDSSMTRGEPAPEEENMEVPDEDADEVTNEEGAEEEEALFSTMELEEQEKEQAEKATHAHHQPSDVTSAPRLLQKALEQGQVAADDSEEDIEQAGQPIKEESANGVAPKPAAAPNDPDAEKSGSNQAAEHSNEAHHVHQRRNQLDFLLSKASEYSNFIARDLDDLQASMADDARRYVEKEDKKKKRKGSSEGKAAKKLKSNKALASAQAKDAAVRAGSRPIFLQPQNLAEGCILKDYQLEGVRWLASLYENGVSGILADEMGLGKTIQCVALIAHLLTKGVSGPFLIVAPLATLPNWVREIQKWLPSQPVVRYHGPSPEREALLRGPLNAKLKRNPDFPIIVTSYEVSIRDQNKLEKLSEFTYLVVDEGHRLKNHRCTLLASLKRLKAANRLLLTGTPIQNTLNELWSLLNFVNPQIFDDLSVFQSWFGFKDIGQKNRGATDELAIMEEERNNQTVSKLHDILRPFLLRRMKTDVLKDMPPKKEVIVYSGISKLQAGYAELIEKGTLRDVLTSQGIEMGRTLSQTNKMMNHRKNINHPFLFGEPLNPSSGIPIGTDHPQLLVRASGKFALLDRMLERLHRDGHQVLIFSQMTKVMNIMEDYLNFRRWRYCRIDGTTHIDERQAQMDAFNAEKTSGINGERNQADDRIFVFLLSTRAGGLGINLTAADTCIIFDSDWNPHADSQAMDRCHRVGQTLPVAVYRLLTVNSVDIEMMEKQVSKKKLERMTIAGGDFRKAGRRSRGDITFEHLRSLLQSDIKDMNAKGGDVEDVKIDDDEFDMIMDRKKLFGTGAQAIPTEGRMYDVIDAAAGDVLGAMNNS